MASPVEVGHVLVDRYELAEEIGRGAVGVVYRARDLLRNRPVAVKILRSEHDTRPISRRLFHREAEAAAQLSHPGIVRLLDFARAPEGPLFLVMELFAGDTMKRRVGQDAPVALLVETARQVARALAYAHARGVVHRDLKPGNILLGKDEGALRVTLVDFGTAHLQGEVSADSLGYTAGTPAYMAPEQGIYDGPAVDQYALGVILYESISGRKPFVASNIKELLRLKRTMPPRPLEPAGGAIPERLGTLIRRLLFRQPDERFALTAHVADELDAIFEALPEAERAHVAPPQLSRQPSEIVRAETTGSLFFHLRREPGFVDRERELGRLMTLAEQSARSGEPAYALVTGSPGVGKSRLLDELAFRLESQGRARPLRIQFDEPETDIEEAFGAGLDRLFSTRSADREKVEERVRDWFVERGGFQIWELNAVADAIRPLYGASSAPDLSEKQRRLTALRRVLATLATEYPLLVVLDDIDRAPRGAAEWLAAVLLAPEMEELPIFVVASAEADEAGAAGLPPELESNTSGGKRLRHIALRPLSDEALGDAIDGAVSLGPSLRRVVLGRARGNPLFALQIVRHLYDSRALVRTGLVWELQSGTDIASVVPNDLEAVIERRLSALEEGVNGDRDAVDTVLQRAVMLGTEFDTQLLHRFLRLEGRTELTSNLDAMLFRLTELGVLDDTSPGNAVGIRYAFDPPALTTAIAQQLASAPNLRVLHRIAADIKADVYRNAPSHAEEIARHLTRAGAIAESIQYRLVAARAAMSEGRYADAYAAFQTIEAGLLTIQAPSDDPMRLRLYREQTETAIRLGDFGQARESLEQLREALGERAERDGAFAYFDGFISLHREDVISGARRLNHAAALALEEEAPGFTANCLYGLAKSALFRGDCRTARPLFEKARDAFATLEIERSSVESAILLGRIALWNGDVATARTVIDESLDRAKTLATREVVADALLAAGELARRDGQHANARSHFERAFEVSTAVGINRLRALALHHTGRLERGLERWDDARSHVSDSAELFEQLGDRTNLARAEFELAQIAARSGDANGAAEHARSGLALQQSTRCRHPELLQAMDEIGQVLGDAELAASLQEVRTRSPLRC